MAAPGTSTELAPGGSALERWLLRPGVQRSAAMALSAVGLCGGLVQVAILLKLGHSGRRVPIVGSELVSMIDLVSAGMVVALVMVAGAMGLVLAIRGRRNALPRLLALSCAAISACFGMFGAVRMIGTALIDPRTDMHLVPWIGLAVALTVAAVLLFGIFAVFQFLVLYPKPVRLLGTDFGADGLPLRGKVAEWKWRWFTSPQFGALLAGTAVILMLGSTLDLTRSTINMLAGYYFLCWLPFAVIAAKQPLLDEEDRRSVRWVFLGQAVWMVLFLASLLVVYALVVGEVLRFANWNHSTVFAEGFFTFFFAGFAIVLLVTLAISIFYHGTLDPDLMIRRTWVLAVVGLVFGAIFVTLERLLADAIAAWLEVSAANALTVVGAITAGLVYPVRTIVESRVKGVIERWRSAQAIADGIRGEAAIVFADLSGYTALTERNEREALIMAAIFHRDAQELAGAHDGKLIKTIGDAVLLRFAAVDDAFAATRELTRLFAAHVAAMSMTPLPIHAAVHFGEVVESSTGDVFGSTVNIAARLLGTAGPEEIVASRAAVERAQGEAEARFVGGKKLKNVEAPVDCFLLGSAAA